MAALFVAEGYLGVTQFKGSSSGNGASLDPLTIHHCACRAGQVLHYVLVPVEDYLGVVAADAWIIDNDAVVRRAPDADGLWSNSTVSPVRGPGLEVHGAAGCADAGGNGLGLAVHARITQIPRHFSGGCPGDLMEQVWNANGYGYN